MFATKKTRKQTNRPIKKRPKKRWILFKMDTSCRAIPFVYRWEIAFKIGFSEDSFQDNAMRAASVGAGALLKLLALRAACRATLRGGCKRRLQESGGLPAALRPAQVRCSSWAPIAVYSPGRARSIDTADGTGPVPAFHASGGCAPSGCFHSRRGRRPRRPGRARRS